MSPKDTHLKGVSADSHPSADEKMKETAAMLRKILDHEEAPAGARVAAALAIDFLETGEIDKALDVINSSFLVEDRP